RYRDRRTPVRCGLAVAIRAVHGEVKGRPGSPRVPAELAAHGHPCCVHTVAGLMRQAGIVAPPARQARPTPDSNHALPVADYLLELPAATLVGGLRLAAGVSNRTGNASPHVHFSWGTPHHGRYDRCGRGVAEAR